MTTNANAAHALAATLSVYGKGVGCCTVYGKGVECCTVYGKGVECCTVYVKGVGCTVYGKGIGRCGDIEAARIAVERGVSVRYSFDPRGVERGLFR